MAKKPIEVEALGYDAARRNNIPAAGFDGVDRGSRGVAGGAAGGSGA